MSCSSNRWQQLKGLTSLKPRIKSSIKLAYEELYAGMWICFEMPFSTQEYLGKIVGISGFLNMIHISGIVPKVTPPLFHPPGRPQDVLLPYDKLKMSKAAYPNE